MRPALLVLVPVLVLVGCDKGEHGRKRGKGGRRGEAVPVAAQKVKREPVRETLPGHAFLGPEALVDVACKAEGEVIAVEVEEKDTVAKGTALAQLDPKRARLRLREAEQRLEQAWIKLRRQMDLGRLAKAEDIETAREEVNKAQIGLETARLDLADTTIRSPITGVVGTRSLTRGQWMRRGDIAFKIADRSRLLARVRVPEALAGRVHRDQKAWIKIDDRSEPIAGFVLRVSPLVDTASGTVEATVAVTGEVVRTIDTLQRFVSVEIILEERPEALTIPQSALSLRGEEDAVLVCEETKEGEKGLVGVVRLRAIKVGVRNAGRVEILEGLEEGDWVVTAAPDDLRDGSKVRIVPPAKDAER